MQVVEDTAEETEEEFSEVDDLFANEVLQIKATVVRSERARQTQKKIEALMVAFERDLERILKRVKAAVESTVGESLVSAATAAAMAVQRLIKVDQPAAHSQHA